MRYDRKFPKMVSFPRCGSHWLRHLLSLYFDKPISPFDKGGNKDYLLYAVHDYAFDKEFVDVDNCIYLYREPVDVVYSETNFYANDKNAKTSSGYNGSKSLEENIASITRVYNDHIKEWLLDRKYEKMTPIVYSNLKNDYVNEFSKAIKHFTDEELDLEKMERINQKSTKSEINNIISDKRVINLNNNYDGGREEFRNKYKELIYSNLDEEIKSLFK